MLRIGAGRSILTNVVERAVGTPNPTACRRPSPCFSCDQNGVLQRFSARTAEPTLAFVNNPRSGLPYQANLFHTTSRAIFTSLRGPAPLHGCETGSIASLESIQCLVKGLGSADPSGMVQSRARPRAMPCNRRDPRHPRETTDWRCPRRQDLRTPNRFRTGRSSGFSRSRHDALGRGSKMDVWRVG
jgi:hypothetical protein